MVRLGDICTKGTSNIAQKDLDARNGTYPILGVTTPPIELQDEFAAFIEQIDKSKYHGEFTCEMEVAA